MAKISRQQKNELFNIGSALAAGIAGAQTVKMLEKNIPAFQNNEVLSGAALGLAGAAMVFFGSAKLNPAGYALIGAASFDAGESALQGLSRIIPVQGLSRISPEQMQAISYSADEMEMLMDEEDED